MRCPPSLDLGYSVTCFPDKEAGMQSYYTPDQVYQLLRRVVVASFGCRCR